MKIEVIGLGYMGLPMATILASAGHEIIGVDVDEKKIATLKGGKLPLSEPDLPELFETVCQENPIKFTTKTEAADFFVIAVPTPFVHETHTSDLTFVRQATKAIVPVLKKGDIVILESTVNPNTCNAVMKPILESSGLVADKDFFIAHCPERAFPGKTMSELVNNDRVVGADNTAAANKVKELYSTIVKGEIFTTNSSTAELVKLMENTYRDVNIALANELAKIAEDINIDIWEAIKLANRHPRVNIHLPGPGVGGHCIAIDPWFLTEVSDKAFLIKTARGLNDSMPLHVAKMVLDMVPGNDKKIAILGVAYKPDVDDARETPAAHVIDLLRRYGYTVSVHDYYVTDKAFGLVEIDEAVKDADCVVLITHHTPYRGLEPDKIGALMKEKNLIDTRNHLDAERWREAGFNVKVLGNGRS